MLTGNLKEGGLQGDLGVGEDNIRMDLEEIGINAGNWVDSAQDRNYWRALVNAGLNLRVPYAMELVSQLVGRLKHLYGIFTVVMTTLTC